MKIELKILDRDFYLYMGQQLPSYATPGSAGIDLVCTEDVVIYPGETKMLPTGLAIHIGSGCRNYPEGAGYEDEHVMGMIVPRSGLGSKGLILGNTIGIIDEDYQGEIMVCAWNRNERYTVPLLNPTTGNKAPALNAVPIKLKAGDRFCQLIFVPVVKAQFEVVEEFSNKTERGSGRFGHTDLGSTSCINLYV